MLARFIWRSCGVVADGGAAPRSHALNSERRPRSAGGTTHTRRATSQAAPMPLATSFCSNGTCSTPSHVSSTLRFRGRYMPHAKQSETTQMRRVIFFPNAKGFFIKLDLKKKWRQQNMTL